MVTLRSLRVTAAAVLVGAIAAAVVTARGLPPWSAQATSSAHGGDGAGQARTAVASPVISPILPFTAKLTSSNIPDKSGGVRSGACSGALIDPLWVITAGHCFHDVEGVRKSGRQEYDMMVTIGKLKDSDPGGHTVQVVDVKQSPVNDLAVVKLSRPVEGIVPLVLEDRAPSAGQRLEFAGWGSLSATSRKPSDHLKRGEFTVDTVKETTMEASPVVARTVENGPCPMDSGAPYYVSGDQRTGRLVAVENSGPPCPQPGQEIIARVDVVADWIRAQVAGSPQ